MTTHPENIRVGHFITVVEMTVEAPTFEFGFDYEKYLLFQKTFEIFSRLSGAPLKVLGFEYPFVVVDVPLAVSPRTYSMDYHVDNRCAIDLRYLRVGKVSRKYAYSLANSKAIAAQLDGYKADVAKWQHLYIQESNENTRLLKLLTAHGQSATQASE